MRSKINSEFKSGILILILLCLVIASCKNEIISIDKKTVLQGVVSVYDEFSSIVDDGDSVLITIKDTPFSTTTDSEGFFKFEDVPMGKYKLLYEKNGYMPDSTSWEIAGIKDTLNVSYSIIPVSKTVITDFSMELNGYDLYAKGTITHRSPIINFDHYTEPSFDWDDKTPTMEIFCSENSNVSREAYDNWMNGTSTDLVYRFTYPVFFLSGEKFEVHILWPTPWPPSGKTYHYVAYGGGGFRSKSNHPSNVFSLTGN
jgi:hypothetical protein